MSPRASREAQVLEVRDVADENPMVYAELTIELTDTSKRSESHAQFLRFRSAAMKLAQEESSFFARPDIYWDDQNQGGAENLVTVFLRITAPTYAEVARIGEHFVSKAAEEAGIHVISFEEEPHTLKRQDVVFETSGRKLVHTESVS